MSPLLAKKPSESKTLIVGGSTLAGALTVLALHALGVEQDEATLGAAVACAVQSVVMIFLRYQTKSPVRSTRSKGQR